MEETKGHCKHGEFILTEGCPQCIAEARINKTDERVLCNYEEDCDYREGAYCKGGNPDCAFGKNYVEHKPKETILNMKDVKKQWDSGAAEMERQSQAADHDIEPAAETALVKVKPEADQAVIALHEQSLKLEQYAVALVVTNDGDVKSATNDLSIISGLKKAIEEKRKEYTQPINDHLKAVNEAFKALTEPLTEADKITRTKILDYRAEQERQRQEAEEIARLEREAAERRAALTGEPIVVPEVVEAPPEAPDRYHAEMGTLGKATIWKFEVIDFVLVPDEYKLIDVAKVGKVVRAGLRSIPGIRIYSEETLRVNAKKGE